MARKLTTEEVIKQFKEVHGDFYDYSLVEYINTMTKVKIKCPIHGIFEQTPDAHKVGKGCTKCGRIKTAADKKFSTEEIVEQFKLVHGDFYDYSLVEYINAITKVKIRCPIHGVFEQTPHGHKQGKGCLKCGGKEKLTAEEIVEQFKLVHGDFYDYSLVDYINARNKVKIICPIHGIFEQIPDAHKRGQGCPICVGIGLTNEEIIEEFKLIHGDFYDYSLVEYINARDKVKIKCPIHGVFEQTPSNHRAGKGCTECGIIKTAAERKFSTEEIVDQFKLVHGDFYGYSLVEYVGIYNKVKIKCPIHGIFEQTPNCHKSGKGCPRCVGIGITTEEIIEEFKKAHGDLYDYSLVEYLGGKIKVKIKCSIHGVFEQTPDAHKRGQGCPDCSESGYKDNHENGASLYIYKRGYYLKFGITNLSVNERAKKSCGKVFFTILLDYHSDDASMARYVESKIKADKSLITDQARRDGNEFEGYSETVSEDKLDELLALVDKYVKEWENA